MIHICNLSFSYGKKEVLKETSIQFKKGNIYGLLGPNGAGKTTLMKLMCGMIKGKTGSVEINSEAPSKRTAQVLSSIFYLPEHPVATIDKIKTFAKEYGWFYPTFNYEEFEQLIKEFRIDIDAKFSTLSTGESKKAFIAFALALNTPYLLLDEPTNGLDPLIQKEVYQILKERNREGATVFLSSHNLSEISRYCAETAIIREGRILLQGKVSDLAYTGVKRIVLRNAQNLPPLENARALHSESGTTTFLYSGDVKELVSYLTTVSFDDITIRDPELDEIFLHYYEKGGATV